MNWWKKVKSWVCSTLIKNSEGRALDGMSDFPPPVPKEEPVPSVKISLIGPGGQKVNLSPEEQEEMNAAIKELESIFSGQDAFASLEAFMKGNSSERRVPFVTANGLPDGQNQVLEEMENHKDDTDHWSDSDFLEHLMSYYHQGYEFEGLEQLFNKYQEKKELTEEERRKVKSWYFLAAQEIVYDV